MITLLRNKPVQRGLFLALCVLVIPGFVFISMSDQNNGLNHTAGTVGGQKIKVQEFIRNFEAMRRELEVFGGADLSKLGNSVDFEALAWQRILLVRAAKAAGVRVTDAEVVKWIQEQPAFQENGAFSKARYQTILDDYLKMDAKTFEEESREYLSLQRYRDQIRGSWSPSEAELQERFRLLYGPRDVEYVLFSKDAVGVPEAATEEERKSMYNRLAGRLMSQEAVQIRYLAVPSGSALPEGTAEAAKWTSESTRTPWVAREEALPGIGAAPELSAAIFALKNSGDRTAWLEHEGKQYRFELIEHKAQAPMAYDDAHKVLDELVGQEKVFRAVIEKASKFSESLESRDWNEAVKAENLELNRVNGYQPGDTIEKIGKINAVGQVLAEMEAGKTSGPIPTSTGLAVFKVVSQADPDPKLFEEKRAEIEKNLRLKREMDVFGKALRALQADLKPNTEVLAKLFPAKYGVPAAAPAAK